MTESIGSYLKREREFRKIPIEEIAGHTRIRLEYLHAIESEHFEKLPGLTFAKGYLRAYASYIGLNADEVLLRFEDYLKKLSGEDDRESSKLGMFFPVLVIVCAVLALVFFLWVSR